MEIEILEFADGAEKASGLTVVIDVFRAFSVACYAFDSGAARYITTNDVDKAFGLRKSYRNAVLIGERNERKIPGSDFGNSPTEIIKEDLTGRTVIQTTTAGTAGIANAIKADILLTGSIVNAGAVIRYIKEMKPDHVSLVAMGHRGRKSAEEDLLCAEIIASGLKNLSVDFSGQINELRNSSGKRFFDPANLDFSPPTDFFLCTMKDRFDFVLKAERRLDGNTNLQRIDI